MGLDLTHSKKSNALIIQTPPPPTPLHSTHPTHSSPSLKSKLNFTRNNDYLYLHSSKLYHTRNYSANKNVQVMDYKEILLPFRQICPVRFIFCKDHLIYLSERMKCKCSNKRVQQSPQRPFPLPH